MRHPLKRTWTVKDRKEHEHGSLCSDELRKKDVRKSPETPEEEIPKNKTFMLLIFKRFAFLKSVTNVIKVSS